MLLGATTATTRGDATPTEVALRLSNVVIHRNRALFAADVRLDSLIVTRTPDGHLACAAHTERIHNIHDEDTLPLDRVQLFHGPVVDYLDIAIWASRDSRDSVALSDLLREKLTDPHAQGAVATLGGLFLAAPVAATAATAVGAGAIVVTAAYELLRKAIGDSIGLYRTTLLAQERFGLDRPLIQRQVRAQDFSFCYTVHDVQGSA